jgi:hypothetical protein
MRPAAAALCAAAMPAATVRVPATMEHIPAALVEVLVLVTAAAPDMQILVFIFKTQVVLVADKAAPAAQVQTAKVRQEITESLINFILV